jgi:chemotaxis protein CheZ
MRDAPVKSTTKPVRGQPAPTRREVVTAMPATINGELSATETSLLSEIEALGRTIAVARQEISALRVDDIMDRDLPFATDELDAIVQHTAVATNAILESCELLDNIASGITGAAAVRLRGEVTKIYEACGFQDITGQRITKVVTTLKVIEEKVSRIVTMFGRGVGAAATTDRASASGLVNGPQLPSNPMDQSEIDKLLASLG